MMLSFDGQGWRRRESERCWIFRADHRFLCWRTFSDLQFDDYVDVRLVLYRENTRFAFIVLRSNKPDLFGRHF